MAPLDAKLQQALDKHRHVGTLRSLQVADAKCIDFFSNDYLGLARSPALRKRVQVLKQQLQASPEALLGATVSRLISGNSSYLMQMEKELAGFYNVEELQDVTLLLLPQKGLTLLLFGPLAKLRRSSIMAIRPIWACCRHYRKPRMSFCSTS
jgi:hypothetical protein